MKSKLRNKTDNCETVKRYLFSRFNAVKHGGYASRIYFEALTRDERLQQRKTNLRENNYENRNY